VPAPIKRLVTQLQQPQLSVPSKYRLAMEQMRQQISRDQFLRILGD